MFLKRKAKMLSSVQTTLKETGSLLHSFEKLVSGSSIIFAQMTSNRYFCTHKTSSERL